MAQATAARTKINTEVTQPARGRWARPSAGRPRAGRSPKGPRVGGDARESVRPARPVVELEFGILVYPPEADWEPWRAVFTENGQRRFRQGATEAKLAEKLQKGRERLSVGPGNMERTGADLIGRGRGRRLWCRHPSDRHQPPHHQERRPVPARSEPVRAGTLSTTARPALPAKQTPRPKPGTSTVGSQTSEPLND
jgi:hypothetical protein